MSFLILSETDKLISTVITEACTNMCRFYQTVYKFNVIEVF